MLKRLRWKFVGITMLIVTLMLGIIFGVLYHATREELEKDSLRTMYFIADDPFHRRRPGDQTEQVHLPYFTLQVDLWGNLTATSGGYFDLSDRDYLLSVLEAAEETGEDTGILRQYNLRFSRIRKPLSDVMVFVDMSSEQAVLGSLLQMSLLVGILAWSVFFVISLVLAKWAVKPVDRAWQQQKQFVADASHELKTPLTVILTNAELLQSMEATQEQQRAAEGITAASRQMRGLVAGLLELAKVDHNAELLQKETVDLSRLVEDSILTFEPLYYEAGRTVCGNCAPGLSVLGDLAYLQQVVEILLDNAMKYSNPASWVDVVLKCQGSHALLIVTSAGTPLTPEERKNIFKRFYRVDKTRGMSGSYGLGLSIASRIVQAHRGKIWAESETGINRFLVQLPLCSGKRS